MTKLSEALLQVKDENLSKEGLDSLYSSLALLRSDVRLELATLEKKQALFLLLNPEKSVAQRKIEWNGSDEGQRKIELKAYVLALGDAMESVKTRIYSML